VTRKLDTFNWNDRALATVAALWAEGVTTAEIGRRMGITKNQVIGKVHRLKLPQRPNPVKSAAPAKPKPERGKVTLHSVKQWVLHERSPFYSASVMPPLDEPFSKAEPMHSERRVALKLPLPVGTLPPSRSCQWPTSAGRPWTFCGCAVVPGFSWCAEHKARVFERRAA